MGCLALIITVVVLGAAFKFPWLGIPVCLLIIWKSDDILDWMDDQEWNTATEMGNKILVYGGTGFLLLASIAQIMPHKERSTAAATEASDDVEQNAKQFCEQALLKSSPAPEGAYSHWNDVEKMADGRYSVTIERALPYTDSTCPIQITGKCVVSGEEATVTQDYQRDGYVSCG